jgi:hypothetical protein
MAKATELNADIMTAAVPVPRAAQTSAVSNRAEAD